MDRDAAALYLGDAARAVVAVLAVGLLLVAVAGVWPPLVAIESPSMEPHVETGDMVLVSGPERLPGDAADPNGIVTAAAAGGYSRLGAAGDVVVFSPPGRAGPPIIHRAQFSVEKGENWYGRADPAYLRGADNCRELPACPAPHAGYITKGDNNAAYDQAAGIAPVVRSSWIEAKAQVDIPKLGWVRLAVAGKA